MNVSKRNVTFIAIPIFGLMLAFQNCSEVDFTKANGELVEKSDFDASDLVPSDGSGPSLGLDPSDDSDSSAGVDPKDPDSLVEDDPSVEPDPSKDDDKDRDPVIARPDEDDDGDKDMPVEFMPDRGKSKDNPGKKDDFVREDREDKGKSPSKSSDSAKFLCGIEGPGKSVVLGFVSDSELLIDQNATSSAVCMSIEACLDIASQAFDVIGPVRGQGICKEGKENVVILSDDQVQDLVDKIEE